MDSVWYGKFIGVFFDTFTKVRMCGQHPGRMSRVVVRVVIFMSLVFFSCFRAFWTYLFFCFFWLKKFSFTHCCLPPATQVTPKVQPKPPPSCLIYTINSLFKAVSLLSCGWWWASNYCRLKAKSVQIDWTSQLELSLPIVQDICQIKSKIVV